MWTKGKPIDDGHYVIQRGKDTILQEHLRTDGLVPSQKQSQTTSVQVRAGYPSFLGCLGLGLAETILNRN